MAKRPRTACPSKCAGCEKHRYGDHHVIGHPHRTGHYCVEVGTLVNKPWNFGSNCYFFTPIKDKDIGPLDKIIKEEGGNTDAENGNATDVSTV